jgi:hypothetical protein
VAGPVSPESGGGLKPGALAPAVVAGALGLFLASRALAGRETGESLNEGPTAWALLLLWLAALLITGAIRGRRQRRLIALAEAGGGTITDPVSPVFWPATVLGIVWRTVLFVGPGLIVAWYASAAGAAAPFWWVVAVLLLLLGAALAVSSLRLSVRNARRRVDGLPPVVPTPAPADMVSAPEEPAPTPAPAESEEPLGQRIAHLAELADLRDRGAITEAEFETLKARALREAE